MENWDAAAFEFDGQREFVDSFEEAVSKLTMHRHGSTYDAIRFRITRGYGQHVESELHGSFRARLRQNHVAMMFDVGRTAYV